VITLANRGSTQSNFAHPHDRLQKLIKTIPAGQEATLPGANNDEYRDG
jgi:hypothetical protein